MRASSWLAIRLSCRSEASMRFQTQARQLRQQTPNHPLIFFRLKAACAVNQYATGLNQPERGAGDGKLLVGHPAEIIRLQSPSHIDPAAHDSRIRARRIHQHTIEWLD